MSPNEFLYFPWAGMLWAWLLTYFIHSTLFLGIAWLVCRSRWIKDLAVLDAVWKTARQLEDFDGRPVQSRSRSCSNSKQ